ncbi:nuclear transport factor 2 family protein [Actinoplanes sp. LDG1-06]|uniref:Nuclear transport factor 2 family protein n=1 Tax=Paractinoplanes ovalisporus TaxID=2810368 RepID=A0ABS2AJ35_9ACTN|nr:nuclear transport factor 2 family protein [Actinoplanes ovalisporus]MBM2619859.1 nuclear transport factor 2 family protein [Actinoplanes ovalisporus]
MDIAAAHIDRFNTAVVSGDWKPFVDALHPDVVMTFVGVPVGPFRGRDVVGAAYEANPPTDTMRPVPSGDNGRIGDDNGRIEFEWDKGGTGTLTLGYADGRVISMLIEFH